MERNVCGVCVSILLFTDFYFTESRESVRVREKRGKVTRASTLDFNTDVTQDLDANDGDRPLPQLQTSFLSPSVLKYLELGELTRSIPGKPRNIGVTLNMSWFTSFALS